MAASGHYHMYVGPYIDRTKIGHLTVRELVLEGGKEIATKDFVIEQVNARAVVTLPVVPPSESAPSRLADPEGRLAALVKQLATTATAAAPRTYVDEQIAASAAHADTAMKKLEAVVATAASRDQMDEHVKQLSAATAAVKVHADATVKQLEATLAIAATTAAAAAPREYVDAHLQQLSATLATAASAVLIDARLTPLAAAVAAAAPLAYVDRCVEEIKKSAVDATARIDERVDTRLAGYVDKWVGEYVDSQLKQIAATTASKEQVTELLADAAKAQAAKDADHLARIERIATLLGVVVKKQTADAPGGEKEDEYVMIMPYSPAADTAMREYTDRRLGDLAKQIVTERERKDAELLASVAGDENGASFVAKTQTVHPSVSPVPIHLIALDEGAVAHFQVLVVGRRIAPGPSSCCFRFEFAARRSAGIVYLSAISIPFAHFDAERVTVEGASEGARIMCVAPAAASYEWTTRVRKFGF